MYVLAQIIYILEKNLCFCGTQKAKGKDKPMVSFGGEKFSVLS